MSLTSQEAFVILPVGKKIAGTTIPPEILPSQQRRDLVLINEILKSIIIIELTVPFEQNIHKVYERKLNKYAGLTSDLQEQGYDTKLLCVEVGSRRLITDFNTCSFQSIFPVITKKKNPKTNKQTKTKQNKNKNKNKKILKQVSKKISEISQSTCNSLLLCYILFKI